MQMNDDIYRQHANYVYKYLISMCGSEDLAEELTQETFYQAIKSIDRFDGSCKISTWLCSIAKNQLLVYRRKHPEYAEIENAEQVVQSSEETVIAELDRLRLLSELHSCPEPFRELVYLRLFADLSFKEIGEIMGKTENWARVTFFRAKAYLKGKVEKDE